MVESVMGDSKISSIDSKVVAEHEQEEDMGTVDTRVIIQAMEAGITEDSVAVLQMGGQESTRLQIRTIDAEE
jgi:hypothetical protein